MKRLRTGVLALGLLGLAACGGRAVEEPGSDSGSSAGAGSGDSKPNQPLSQAGGAGKPGVTPSLPSHNLGTCKPGFSRAEQPDRNCNWLTESGLCFDKLSGACDCICPRTGDSVCFTAFDGGGTNAATLVYCE